MTRYLRQLMRRTGSRSGGHNDSVIWNISQRFPQLRVGQQLTVRVSYFAHKALSDMRSCTYEIQSLGIFPRIFHNRGGKAHAAPQSSDRFVSLSPLVRTPPKPTPSTATDPSPTPPPVGGPHGIPSVPPVDGGGAQSLQIPQVVIDTIAHLANYVENLQQQLLTAQSTLHSHEVLLGVMEEHIQRLEVENRELKKIHELRHTSSVFHQTSEVSKTSEVS